MAVRSRTLGSGQAGEESDGERMPPCRPWSWPYHGGAVWRAVARLSASGPGVSGGRARAFDRLAAQECVGSAPAVASGKPEPADTADRPRHRALARFCHGSAAYS
jgi:hypothetical protein